MVQKKEGRASSERASQRASEQYMQMHIHTRVQRESKLGRLKKEIIFFKRGHNQNECAHKKAEEMAMWKASTHSSTPRDNFISLADSLISFFIYTPIKIKNTAHKTSPYIRLFGKRPPAARLWIDAPQSPLSAETPRRVSARRPGAGLLTSGAPRAGCFRTRTANVP